MSVASLLAEVQRGLIAHEQLMASLTQTDSRIGVGFVTVPQTDTMKNTSDECCHGIGGTLSHTCIELFILMLVLQTSRHIHPIGRTICASQDRGVYR